MIRAVRVASVNNNDDTMPRVRLELRKNDDGSFGWFTKDGESCNLTSNSVAQAMDDIFESYGRTPVWGLKIGSR
jgi:hypothetical protein